MNTYARASCLQRTILLRPGQNLSIILLLGKKIYPPLAPGQFYFLKPDIWMSREVIYILISRVFDGNIIVGALTMERQIEHTCGRVLDLWLR